MSFSISGNAIDFHDQFVDDAKEAVRNGTATFEQWWWMRSRWSRATFGSPSFRGPEGPVKHLEKEVKECLDNIALIKSLYNAPGSDENRRAMKHYREELLGELVDAVFLAFDAAERAGFSISDMRQAMNRKLVKNMDRKWPTASATEAVEHVRVEESSP